MYPDEASAVRSVATGWPPELQAKHHGTVALVSRCERAGLVRRETDPDDRCHVRVYLTEAGEQGLTRLTRLHRDGLQSLANVFRVPRIAAFNDRA